MFILLVLTQIAWFFTCMGVTYCFGKKWMNRKKPVDNQTGPWYSVYMEAIMNLKIGQILFNVLSNGQILKVRVMQLNVAGTNMPRVCFAHADRPDQELIDNNLTWAANLERLFYTHEAAIASHYDLLS